MDYDLSRLQQLGRKRKKLLDQLEELRPAITAEVLAAHDAGVKQATIVQASHYTRDWVRQLTMTAEQREAAKQRRQAG
ncbi:hypothetical protein MED01_002440 [Micromonospora sp. MED01]|uniref:hypothetical protein n=1 Tax=Micromonospora alfalfae TaxID=2911212 RepID=UPI001EE8A693|nr:hypothetical protein [Micromonospora alfalfae]MCG5464274.1 hypothetical protein [Micromonospora alfalfae]